MKKVILTETLCLEENKRSSRKKNLVVNLLELIRVKKAIMQTMKPVEYKHLLVTLKTKLKKLKGNKRTRRRNKKPKT